MEDILEIKDSVQKLENTFLGGSLGEGKPLKMSF